MYNISKLSSRSSSAWWYVSVNDFAQSFVPFARSSPATRLILLRKILFRELTYGQMAAAQLLLAPQQDLSAAEPGSWVSSTGARTWLFCQGTANRIPRGCANIPSLCAAANSSVTRCLMTWCYCFTLQRCLRANRNHWRMATSHVLGVPNTKSGWLPRGSLALNIVSAVVSITWGFLVTAFKSYHLLTDVQKIIPEF